MPPCDWDETAAREALVDTLSRSAHAALAEHGLDAHWPGRISGDSAQAYQQLVMGGAMPCDKKTVASTTDSWAVLAQDG